MRIAEAFVELRVDSKGAQADVKKQAQSLGSTFAQVFGAAAFGAGLKKAIDEGSRLEQSVGAIDAIFGKAGKTIDQWAKDAAKNLGLAESEAREALALIGAQLKNFGFDVEEARDKGQVLVELGADLAATFGGTTVEAIEALTSALRGEMDPIERYGVSLNDARLKAKALELGLYSGKGALDANAKATAALELITEQTATSQGQFARELDTVAGRQKVATAEAMNSAASLGQNLAPIYERIVEVVGFLAKAFGDLPAPLQYATVGLAGFAALSGPIESAVGAIGKATDGIKGMGAASKWALGSTVAILGVALVAWTLFRKEEDEAAKAARELNKSLMDATRSLDLQEIALLSAADAAEKYGDALYSEADKAARQKVIDNKLLQDSLLQLGISIDDFVAASRDEQAALEMSSKVMAAVKARKDELTAAFRRGEIATEAELKQLRDHNVDPMLRNYDALLDALGLYASAANKSADELMRLTRLGDENAAAALFMSAAWEDLDWWQKAVVRTTLTTAEATEESADALYEQADAATASERAIADLESAFSGLLGTLDDRDALRNMQQSFDDLQQKALDAWYAAASGSADAEQAQRDYQQAVDDAKRDVIEFAEEIGDIPPEAVSEIIALIDEGKLAEAETKLAALERERRIMFSAVIDPATDQITIGKLGQVRLMAMGGLVRSATPAIVGEAGTEAVLPLTRPDRMAQILADPEVGGPVAAAMGGGGGATHHHTWHVYGAERSFVADIARQMRIIEAGG